MKFRFVFFATIIALTYSCTISTQEYASDIENSDIKYAEGFCIKNHGDFREIIINEPYKNSVLERYYLVEDDQTKTPEDGVRLHVPLGKIGIASCTHIGFMEALGLLDHISGICLPNTIYSPAMRQLYQCGKAIDMGDAMSIDPERALLAHADAIMISGYGQGDVNPDRLKSIGIQVIYNNEWTEVTPLGRAEWIKMVGALFCRDSLADAVFETVEKAYNDLAENSKQTTNQQRPSIMSGNNFRGTWYMSSGDSYMGRLFADAGADYYFENDSTKGSIPLSIESVLQHFGNADVWVGSNGTSLDDLAKSDEKHTWFSAYKNKRVYNFYRRRTETGANDYWERGVVHPEELLSDLVWALYPDSMKNYEPIYIQQLQ